MPSPSAEIPVDERSSGRPTDGLGPRSYTRRGFRPRRAQRRVRPESESRPRGRRKTKSRRGSNGTLRPDSAPRRRRGPRSADRPAPRVRLGLSTSSSSPLVAPLRRGGVPEGGRGRRACGGSNARWDRARIKKIRDPRSASGGDSPLADLPSAIEGTSGRFGFRSPHLGGLGRRGDTTGRSGGAEDVCDLIR